MLQDEALDRALEHTLGDPKLLYDVLDLLLANVTLVDLRADHLTDLEFVLGGELDDIHRPLELIVVVVRRPLVSFTHHPRDANPDPLLLEIREFFEQLTELPVRFIEKRTVCEPATLLQDLLETFPKQLLYFICGESFFLVAHIRNGAETKL